MRYAKLPIDDLQFAAPVPPDQSTTVLNATVYVYYLGNRVSMDHVIIVSPPGEKILSASAQKDYTLDEDCLSVNVWDQAPGRRQEERWSSSGSKAEVHPLDFTQVDFQSGSSHTLAYIPHSGIASS
ncbi:hypothetical protein BDW42DRAFT_189838 [Aspergillus taichungensis]|uniref:Carboxylesterase type B domain-containing protein n=1 Tax=Aspergillus taichungensis TaxID=482145 RepID=A0A2J5IA40_9EURO|nr:hypothetical protein BDW42DRAFT_189838 [Aspergillus taichungensis]